MSEEFKQIVDSSFVNGIPFWTYNQDYIYGMIPAHANGEQWVEISYTFDDPDEPLVKNERNADLSFKFLLEEVSKGISFYIEDLNVNKIKDFAKSVESKPGPEKISNLISELVNNHSSYSANFPIIKSKDELNILKSKV